MDYKTVLKYDELSSSDCQTQSPLQLMVHSQRHLKPNEHFYRLPLVTFVIVDWANTVEKKMLIFVCFGCLSLSYYSKINHQLKQTNGTTTTSQPVMQN